MKKTDTRFCDPTCDFAFKRIFGSELYKDATIGFINSILTDRVIRDVKFMNVEIPGLTEDDRKSCVDVLCTGDDGSTFIIEMQVVEHEFFRQRTVLYASTLISHLAEKGHEWDYHLNPTYVISVIDFILDEHGPESCIHHYTTREIQTGAVLYGAPEFFFLEPCRFKKKRHELSNYQEKWLFLFRDTKSLEVIPDEFLGDKAFNAYFEASETSKMTQEERILYDRAMITKTDIKYGKEFSFKQGKAEGKAEGIAEGEARGKAETRLEVARKMLAAGVDISIVVDCTGLSRDELAGFEPQSH